MNLHRFRAALVVATVVCVVIPLVASAQETQVELRSTSPGIVGLGESFHYEALVTNTRSEAKVVSFGLELRPVGAGDDQAIVFLRWAGSVPGGATETVTGGVATAQWYRDTGDFEIRVTSTPAESLTFSVGPSSRKIPIFEEIAETLGLKVLNAARYTSGARYSSGAAWADVDRDGDLDVYMPLQDDPAKLFINEGSRFTDRAREYGVLDEDRLGLAAVFGDYDNDGDPDLYVINDEADRLYRNDGGRFEDVTTQAGITEGLPGASASWGDYDNDGFIDLFVTNYGDCLDACNLAQDVLYHNEGNGTFTDQTALLTRTGSVNGAGFQAAWFDYDLDGDVDLYLGNDYVGTKPEPNFLWRNDGPGGGGSWRFTNVSIESRTGFSMNTMGIGIGDYDRDLDFDIALSNIESARLLRNEGDGTFTDRAQSAGVARPLQQSSERSVTWAVSFHDLNNDGWEDLYFVGGLIQGSFPQPQRNGLFVNDHDGTFLDLSAPSGTDIQAIGRGAAFADYDRDGKMDMFVLNQQGRSFLYHNVTEMRKNHWLEVDTIGRASNRDGCGARLVAVLGPGERLMRHVFCGSVGLGSGSDPTVHLGLGRAKKIGKLKIWWPSGRTQVLRDLRADRLITVREPKSR